jgi:hypothetical protein
MKKLFYILLVAFLVGGVSGQDAFAFGQVGITGSCVGNGNVCDVNNPCCPGLYCWSVGTYETAQKSCHSMPGSKGYACINEEHGIDCVGYANWTRYGGKCTLVDISSTNGYRCSECSIPDYEEIGMSWPNVPQNFSSVNSMCQAFGVECSCVKRYNSGSLMTYARWQNNLGYGDVCLTGEGNTMCYQGETHESPLWCNDVETGQRARCMNRSNGVCVYDMDCPTGRYCDQSQEACFVGTTTTTTLATTTTTSVSTTTLPGATSTTTTTLVNPNNECESIHGDADCPMNMYCSTGWDRNNYCEPKKEAWTSSIYSTCYRNHECYSGVCSTHDLNDIDYPTYDDHVYPPYSEANLGQCEPNYFQIDVYSTPEEGVIGEEFRISAIPTFSDNPVKLQSCVVYFNAIATENIWNSTTAFAYTSKGNSFLTANNLVFNPSNSLYEQGEAAIINNTLTEGIYTYFVQCLDEEGNAGNKPKDLIVIYSNHTVIKAKGERLPSTIIKGTTYNMVIAYLDAYKNDLAGASCIVGLNNTNSTLNEDVMHRYSSNIFFNDEGNIPLELWCKKNTYSSAYTKAYLRVSASHCGDGVKNYGEDGIDCGSSCPICVSNPNCKQEYKACSTNSDCCDGLFCDNNKCAVSCENNFYHCGGSECQPCSQCIGDEMCNKDGTQYCLDYDKCVWNNCTTDADCHDVMGLPTVCDSNYGLCKFPSDNSENRTDYELSLKVEALTGGVIANLSGRKVYVGNCDDKTNGFRLSSHKDSMVVYNFNSSSFTPNIPSEVRTKVLGNVSEEGSNFIIPELCDNFGQDEERIYAKVKLKSSDGIKNAYTYVDTLTFRHNLKNSLDVSLSPL